MTSRNFNIGGTWQSEYGWSVYVDDDNGLDSYGKKTYDGIVQYQWDIKRSSDNLELGADHYLVYVPGTTVNNGIWFFQTSTDVDQTKLATHSSTNPQTKDSSDSPVAFNVSGATTSFETADAFVNGVIPTIGSSGPTVTAITVANEIASTREFTVTHTGTLTASDIAYTIDGTDITTLTSPNTPIFDLQTTATGSTFKSYTVTKNGSHSVSIGNAYLNFYVNTSTASPNDIVSNYNIQVTFPAVNVNTPEPWTDQLGTIVTGTTVEIREFTGDRVRIRLQNDLNLMYIFIHKDFDSNTGYKVEAEQWDYNRLTNGIPAYESHVFYVDPDALYQSTESTNKLLTFPTSVTFPNGMLVDTYNWNFASVTTPTATTTQGTNAAGKQDRYPIVMTNLFNRSRSVFSIGLTHKDKWDLFL